MTLQNVSSMTLDELKKYTQVQLRLPQEQGGYVVHEGTFLRHDEYRYMEIEKVIEGMDSFLVHVDFFMLEIFAEIDGEWTYVEQG